MDLDAGGSFDDVPVRNYAIAGDKETAPARKGNILCIERLDRDGRRIYPLDELRQEVLRVGCSRETREKHEKEEY